MAAKSTASMLDSNFDVDKLTYEIFSILENKFLFGCDDHPKLSLTKQHALPLLEIKSGKHVSGKVRILSIDGGGATEGVLAAKSLAHLESTLRRKSGNPNARIADFFDVVAGSGSGGVLAALLFTRGKDGGPMFTAEEALKFVVENRRKICRSSRVGILRRAFGSAKAQKVFGQAFGDLTLKDTLKAVLIPCYDLKTGAQFVFSRADAMEMDGYDFALRDVCGATTADIGALNMKSMDGRTKIVAIGGGVTMNNPTAVAITHVLHNKHEFPLCNGVEDLLVVSLGNGESYSGAGNLTSSPAALIKIAGEGASDTVDQAVSMAFGKSWENNYVRIQANGMLFSKQNGSLDTAMNTKGCDKTKILSIVEEMLAQKSIESVLFQGKKLVENSNLDKLELFGRELIEEQERRKTSALPTVVLKQASTSPRTSSPRTSSATTLSTISSSY